MSTYSNSGRVRPAPQIATTTIPGSDAAHEIARRDVIIDNLQTLLKKRDATIARVHALGEQYASLAPDDDWGDDVASTIQADMGRCFLTALNPPAAS